MQGAQLYITLAVVAAIGGGIGWGLGRRNVLMIEEELRVAQDLLAKREEKTEETPVIEYEEGEELPEGERRRDRDSYYQTPYDKARGQLEDESLVQEPVVVYEEPSEELKADGDEPYLISQRTFVANEKGYTHDTFNYFVKDDMLIDDEGQIVDNVYFLVGRATEEFDVNDMDKNILFVRNNKTQSEYEITCDWNDWNDSDLDTHRPIYLR